MRIAIGGFLRFVSQSPDGVLGANTAGVCLSFKSELMKGSHAFGTQSANATRTVTTVDVFKMALYVATATRNNADTVYNSTGELAGTGNYTQTGATVTNAATPALDGASAYWTPSASVSWGPTFTSSAAFDCAVLYNDSSTSKLEIAVFTFSSQSVTSGTFSLTMPTSNGSTGLLRIV